MPTRHPAGSPAARLRVEGSTGHHGAFPHARQIKSGREPLHPALAHGAGLSRNGAALSDVAVLERRRRPGGGAYRLHAGRRLTALEITDGCGSESLCRLRLGPAASCR